MHKTKTLRASLLLTILFSLTLFGQQPAEKKDTEEKDVVDQPPLEDVISETHHSAHVGGALIDYTARA
ncbi:MAG TPA: hypothetical protein VMY18_10400, partial [Acidobacteriota bacterium]|nr:hypothetical protein [Acidobacteriota bacterium]